MVDESVAFNVRCVMSVIDDTINAISELPIEQAGKLLALIINLIERVRELSERLGEALPDDALRALSKARAIAKDAETPYGSWSEVELMQDAMALTNRRERIMEGFIQVFTFVRLGGYLD